MKELAKVYITCKSMALVVALCIMFYNEREPWMIIMTSLIFMCMFALQIYLIEIKRKSQHWNGNLSSTKNNGMIGILSIMSIGTFVSGFEELLPVLMILLIEIIGYILKDRYFIMASSVVLGILLLIYSPSWQLAGIYFMPVISLFMVLKVSKKLNDYMELVNLQRSEIIKRDEKIKDNQRLIKTIQYAVALEERNRIAARLHDKIGHSISGSILMLEASMLNMKNNTDKAYAGVQKAVINLREGVDDIRSALREERPVKSDINVSHIRLLLEEANAQHDLHANLLTDGDLTKISLELWHCIRDNTLELITNVYKHSSATVFSVKIQVLEAIIRVTYWDNGRCESSFEKGLGLEAVEERTIKCNGKCFMEAGDDGFKVVTLFL